MSTFMKPGRTSALVCTIVALSLAACSGTETASVGHGDGHGAHWGYEADNGPDRWGSMNPAWSLCAEGRGQSPIDLAGAAETELPEVEIHMPSAREVAVLNQAGVLGALDNGHTIQINSKTGETLTVGDKIYSLVQFHFHAPSEHTVDGEHFPMEIHFVHQAEDGALAVVGLLIEEGARNPGIAPLWAQLAGASGTETTVQIPAEFADHIFSGDATGIYHYDGSLTTPPCSEGVRWYVSKTPTRFSKDQIAAFTAIYDHNNRPVQALNDRTLYLDGNPTVTVR
jgi:carbonic anhydrase